MHALKSKLLQNWKSGITVSIVSIPLALALAITSGATPTQGIITAFWAGLLGAIFGGSNFNIIGPTGALAGILITYALAHGSEVLPAVAVLSGLLILIAYIFNLDKYIVFIPRSVVHGFTLGVAFNIALGQLDNIFGITGLQKTDSLVKNILITLQHISQTDWLIVGIFLISTLFILFWNKKFPKIPGAAIVAFLSISAMMVLPALGYTPSILTIGDKYPSLHATLFENPLLQLQWNIFLVKDIWVLAIAVAVISILETLLSGQIADTMTGTKFNRKKEVLGLSIANLGSGLMGGIPATAALARTALNIKSGANHKASGAINAIFVGAIALFLVSFFKLLPMVIVASILVVVAIGMVERKHFIHLVENERIAFVLSLIVAFVVVVEDPMMGILAGTVIALLIFVNKLSYGQTEVLIWKNGKMTEALLKNDFLKKAVIDSDIIVYKITGALTYINMPAHLEAAQKIKNNNYIILSLRHSFYADIDGIDYLGEIIEVLKKKNNKKILIAGINKEIEKLIHKEAFYKKKLVEGKIYKRTSEAIKEIIPKY
ncbi:MAG: SulP family inorganic anion transporter [Candidatus Gracilibacteria bacterium]|nr:SulP family inorganic anion transporter [Candidatus Gracilibacteria bacterium]MDD5179147.1 SulP family inorganic anion transporter [Candidatus Gracilibacteria bacterium]